MVLSVIAECRISWLSFLKHQIILSKNKPYFLCLPRLTQKPFCSILKSSLEITLTLILITLAHFSQ